MTDAHERYEQDLAAHLLGALDADEARALELHLEDCSHCRAERDRLRLATDALPRSVLQVTPPESLKRSLMEAVDEDARAAGQAPRRSLRRRLGRLVASLPAMRPGVAWVSAAFLLAMGIVGGWGITQLTQSEDARVITAQVDAQRVPTGTATLVVPEDGDDGAILRVNGMPSLLSGSVYQVWLQRDGEMVSQGMFGVGEDGQGSAAVADNLAGAEAVLVTRERAGGARAPSEEPILRVTL